MRLLKKPEIEALREPMLYICDLVAERYQVTREQILGREKTSNVVRARRLSIFLIYRHIPNALPHYIAKALGLANETVYSAVSVMQADVCIDRPLAKEVHELLVILAANEEEDRGLNPKPKGELP